MKAWTLLVMSCLLAGACGREDVQLLGPGLDGGTIPEASVERDTGAILGGDGSTPKPCPPPAGRACQETGATCAASSECCSSRCAGGLCLDPGTCAGPGASCTSASACCSGRCEPLGTGGALVCLDYCAPAGVACTRALDCCSTECTAGKCTTGLCAKEGDTCATAADCCSNSCGTDQKCALDLTAACRVSEDDCSSGGGLACCPGVTCNSDQRCDFGAGPCRALGAPCLAASDCCDGRACTLGTCAGACLADSVACKLGADCCSKHCVGTPGTCGEVSSCKLVGLTCKANTDCCSGQCLQGACGSNCEPE